MDPVTTPIAHPGPARVVLGIPAAVSLALAVYLLLFPGDFHENFPLGYAWLPPLGPYDGHVLRDYGSMNLGAAAGAIYALQALILVVLAVLAVVLVPLSRAPQASGTSA